MRAIPAELMALAEEPEGHIGPPPPPAQRIETARFRIVLSPAATQADVSCVRTTEPDLDAVIDEVRNVMRESGHTHGAWYVGPSSRPEGLARLLRERGFIPATRPPYDPQVTAMVLAEAPPPPPANIESRLVGSLDEFVAALKVAMEAFEITGDDAAGWMSAAPALWSGQDEATRFTHIAYMDGKAVGFGFGAAGPAGIILNGSGVIASARGRGVYRAMLAARWNHAVKIGRPGLGILAGPMSLPVLERCGFQRVCPVDVLDDVGMMVR